VIGARNRPVWAMTLTTDGRTVDCRVGLLFQPRRALEGRRRHTGASPNAVRFDRSDVFLAALEAVLLGDASRFDEVFTDDVVFSGPHVVAESLPVVHRELGTPEDALTDVAITVVALDSIGDKVVAEWRLEAMFTRPVLFDDRLLIEPTGAGVNLPGASVAEFRERRIRAFRHYFDDSELLSGVGGIPTHLRWAR
jgi:hypothetical protein